MKTIQCEVRSAKWGVIRTLLCCLVYFAFIAPHSALYGAAPYAPASQADVNNKTNGYKAVTPLTLWNTMSNYFGTNISSLPPVWENYTLNVPFTNTSSATRIYRLSGLLTNNATAGTTLISIFANDTGVAAVTNRVPLRFVTTTTPGTNFWYVDMILGAGGRGYVSNETAIAGVSNILSTGITGYISLSGQTGPAGAAGAAGLNLAPNPRQFSTNNATLTATNGFTATNVVFYGPTTNNDAATLQSVKYLSGASADQKYWDEQITSAGRALRIYDDALSGSRLYDRDLRSGIAYIYKLDDRQSNVYSGNVYLNGSTFLPAPSGALTNLSVAPDGKIVAVLAPSAVGAFIGNTGGAGTNTSFTGTTVNRGIFTNEIQPLLTGNVLNGTNQFNSLSVSSATINGAVSNLYENTEYVIWQTNTVQCVIGTWTNITDYVGWKGILANSVTELKVKKQGAHIFLYINNNPGVFPLTFNDITNCVVDGTWSPFPSITLTNNCNILLTNLTSDGLNLILRQDATGSRLLTYINSALTLRTNASMVLSTAAGSTDVLSIIPGTNSVNKLAILQKGFQ